MIDLLAPRILVTGNYPGSPFNIGDVLNLIKHDDGAYYYQWPEFDGFDRMYESEFKEYPNLFRLLQWWEHREPGEMPGYVKFNHGKIIKVERYSHNNIVWWEADHLTSRPIEMAMPSNKQEYTTYINSKK